MAPEGTARTDAYGFGVGDLSETYRAMRPQQKATGLRALLALERETGTGRGPFIPWLKPRGFLAFFCKCRGRRALRARGACGDVGLCAAARANGDEEGRHDNG